jgi:DNA-directed RNA polymerase specialized sigma24 family protein
MTGQSDQPDKRQQNSETRFCQHVLVVGMAHARRQGLDAEDCQDCAMEFVERMLSVLHARGPALLLHPNLAAWLAVCAHHHACNFRRALHRHSRPCLPLEAADETLTPDHCADLRNLEAALGRDAFQQEIDKALAQMPVDAASMLVAYHYDGADVETLAIAYGKTHAAIRKSLS